MAAFDMNYDFLDTHLDLFSWLQATCSSKNSIAHTVWFALLPGATVTLYAAHASSLNSAALACTCHYDGWDYNGMTAMNIPMLFKCVCVSGPSNMSCSKVCKGCLTVTNPTVVGQHRI